MMKPKKNNVLDKKVNSYLTKIKYKKNSRKIQKVLYTTEEQKKIKILSIHSK